jgi:hypothetical protein
VGGTAITPQQFDKQTGGRHQIHLISLAWGQGIWYGGSYRQWLDNAEAGDYRLMVHISTRQGGEKEAITPLALAKGAGDSNLASMSRDFNESGQYVYVRPMAEMNGYWNVWCAFNSNGTRKGASHSTRAYRSAFKRIAIIMRGGTHTSINKKLKREGLAKLKVSGDLPSSGRVAMVFNPQGEGAPNVTGNQPKDYYPGRKFVDYVANDLYSQGFRANWRAQDNLYKTFKQHPFMVAEWAPWGIDDPAYANRMFDWVAKHKRTVALMYFNGTGTNRFVLATKLRTRAAYRNKAKAARYKCDECGTFTSGRGDDPPLPDDTTA